MTSAIDVFVCDAIRTPIGRFAGSLSSVRPDDLAAHILRSLISRSPSLDPAEIDEVFLGCANQAGEDNRNIARMALLLAGFPLSVPGVTLNRLCASGLDAVGAAARGVASGDIELAIAGGVESMSRAPFVMGKADQPFQRNTELFDTTIGWRFVNPSMKSAYGVDSMPETGDNVANHHNVSREDQDLFAARSQQRAEAAAVSGFLAEEIVPVLATLKKETRLFEADEHRRGETTYETLAKLKPLQVGGSVTAGNSSGINDGAAAMIIASATGAARASLTPRARILGMATAGVAPRTMGVGPVPACQKLLSQLGAQIKDFDVIEINEAFASQSLACLRLLEIPDDATWVNANGGAIALGHPLGMSGARLVLTAVHQMERSGKHKALVTMCVGVGQGVAMALERV